MNRFEKLKAELLPPSDRATGKVVDFMSPEIQEFISRSPFAVISTSNANGDCDSSPKGGRPGFIKVLDERAQANSSDTRKRFRVNHMIGFHQSRTMATHSSQRSQWSRLFT